MARERYLVGAGEDTIHTGVIELKTPRDKRRNWWFYHKTHLIVGIVGTIILGSVIWSIVSKVEPDYTVGMITSYNIPGEVMESLENHLAQYADDRNGDGRVVVQVSSYVFGNPASAEDMQATQASYARFAGDATMASCILYIHDDAGFKSLGDSFQGFFQYNDGTAMPDTAWDYENAMRPWAEVPGLAAFTAQGNELSNWTPEVVQELCSRLRISVRTAEGSNIEKDEKKMAYYEDSMAMLRRLEKDEKLPAAQGE
ncbi:hypothetical protein [Acutalibacter caecimuris]|uniref:hypothetical protein n=1 Tax=Acutalibacter caecimuris TaxID=3093657 RepID=UPI002AC8DD27|nr:hypothetical protein [Acutalibacter sp. M00118]